MKVVNARFLTVRDATYTVFITICILCCRFILTATDLFTKWVVAKCPYTKTAAEVTKKIVSILLDFGLVEKIITDQVSFSDTNTNTRWVICIAYDLF